MLPKVRYMPSLASAALSDPDPFRAVAACAGVGVLIAYVPALSTTMLPEIYK